MSVRVDDAHLQNYLMIDLLLVLPACATFATCSCKQFSRAQQQIV
jgi:hypothetical protein